MALGPVGNAIYINQQVPFVSSVRSDHLARFEIQNFMAQQILNEKEKEIQEVRELEENHAIDPDREHQKQENQEELESQKKAAEKEEDESHEEFKLHLLDIKV